MAEEQYPKSKEEVMQAINEGWAELNTLLDSLTDEQLTQPGPDGGWSVKDHIAHMAVWEAGISALLRKEDRWQAMGVTLGQAEQPDWDEMNATIEAQHTDLSLDEVRDLFARSHQEMLDALEPLTYDELMLPYRHYDTASKSENPVGAYIAGNTWGHWAEHAGWIRGMNGE